MTAAVITSAANPRLKLVRKLESRRQRDKLGLFVCEGEDLVEAARAAGIEPADLLVAGEDVEPANQLQSWVRGRGDHPDGL